MSFSIRNYICSSVKTINISSLNPDYALGIYSNKILLYIYFSTHFSVLDVVLTTPAGEKFRAS